MANQALASASDGSLWAATNNGLYNFNLETGKRAHFRYSAKNPRSLGGDLLQDVFIDASGVVWAGGATSGLSKYAPYREKFRLYRNNPYDDNSLSNNYIRGIAEDADGRLLVATQFGGLNVLDRNTGRWTAYRGNSKKTNSLISDNVRALLKDTDGSIVVGTHLPPGIARLNPKTGDVRRIEAYPEDAAVNTLYLARSGEIWVGNESPIFVQISKDRKSSRRRFLNVLNADEIRRVQTICEDRFGSVWIGTEFGLFELDRPISLCHPGAIVPHESRTIQP